MSGDGYWKAVWCAGWIAVAAALLAGCSVSPLRSADKAYYVLDVKHPADVQSAPAGTGGLEVRPFAISARYEDAPFVYRDGELRYTADFYHAFFTPPANMISDEVRDWLGASGLFANVLSGASQLQPDYVLEGRITDLYGDRSDPRAHKAVLGIQFTLLHDRPAGSELVLQDLYREQIALPDNTPEALVEGWSRALRSILQRFESDLTRRLSKDQSQAIAPPGAALLQGGSLRVTPAMHA